ncbi:MAG: type II toxin-antitoxin system HicA family toxin [Syntrophomonas sp.]
MSSRQVLQRLFKDGWYIVNQSGSHVQLKHNIKKGKVTVPHPKKDLKEKTIRNILKQAGLE